jgi:molybdopterin converting factor small subunit
VSDNRAIAVVTADVLLFAAHREVMGERRLQLELPVGATLDDVYGALVRKQPKMAELRRYTSFAVNREMVDAGTAVCNGDEIALLQPVSGG